ncbi:GHKL domain-containing protein [bacterium]|nr:GHKL domain-containing protein [bacterium]
MIVGLCCLFAGEAAGEGLTSWRFFEASEGLGDTWTSFITVGPSGRVWVSHESEDKLSCLDGWPVPDSGIAHIYPSPGSDLKVCESDSGQLWSVYSKGVQLFRDGRWVRYQIDEITNFLPPSGLRALIPFLPDGPDRVYYLLPNRLMLFDAGTGRRIVVKSAREAGLGRFIDMISARQGGIWVSGERGVARFEPGRAGQADLWREYLLGALPVQDVRSPVEGRPGELFAVAGSRGNCRQEIVRFDGERWRIIPGGGSNIRKVWPGLDGSYWTLRDKNTLAQVVDGRVMLQEKAGILSGNLHEVAVEPNGVFWLSTSHGLARCAPSIWRTPGEVKNIDARVHAIHEDAGGKVWFAAVDRLLVFDGRAWKKYALPRNTETYSYLTQAIASLPDGRLAICTYHYSPFLLLFDPGKERFEYVVPSLDDSSSAQSNRVVGLIAPRRDGKIWVQTLDYWNPANFRLELFDGKNFQSFLDLGEGWKIGRPQFLYETESGDLWIGGSGQDGLGLYKDGRYETFGPDKGFPGGCAYCICEIEPGRIWVGCKNEIYQYDGQQWTVIHSGFNVVNSIVKGRDGIIWVASGTGVHRCREGAWVTNTVEDGLPNTAAYTIAQDRHGRVWAGTISGLGLFHPEADSDPPRTIISGKDNLKETPPDREVHLLFSGIEKWKQTRAERLLFSYRLDQGPWSTFQTGNLAVFQNLPYGRHNFEVRAMDVNFNYDPEPAGFEFRVLLPWYRETGFLVVMGASGTIILFLLGFALRRHFFLEKLVKERTRDLREANVQLQDNYSELQRAEAELKKEHQLQEVMLQNERLLARIASRLNSAAAFHEILNELLNIIAEATSVNHIGLYRLNRKERKASRLAAWIAPASNGRLDGLPALFFPGLPSLVERLFQGETFNPASLERLEPGEREQLEGCGIGPLFILPLPIAEGVIGCFFFSRGAGCPWKPEEEELFGTIADILANGWQRYEHLQARLEADRKKTEAVQMAEKSARMASIGVMASGITHEINQPLNSLRIITEGVLQDMDRNLSVSQEEYAKMFHRMFRQINRIDDIIKHMRAFWVSPVHIAQESFDLNKAVKNALSLIDSQIRAHGIELTLGLVRQSSLIRGNQVHLEQVVINLVVNAMHALNEMPSGDKLIRVLTRRRAGYAVIRVEDNGGGFPEGEEENLFDPFYSTRQPGEGMGLGLAIVNRFVEGMGGTVTARNRKTGGAEFIVELPVLSGQ